MSKKETIEEYLARGGKITKCEPAKEPEEEPELVRSTTKQSGAPKLYSLGDANVLLGEIRKNKRRKKKDADFSHINLAILPPHIRALCVP